MKKRTSGMLMPISSLPSPYGIGTLGKEAFDFIDFLAKSKMTVWQILPLLPTNYGDSPYQSCAGNALNFYFIDFPALVEEGLLREEDVSSLDWGSDPHRVDYGALFRNKAVLLKRAFASFDKTKKDFVSFLKRGEYRDFAVFMTLKETFSHRPWTEWGEYRQYDEEKIADFCSKHEAEIDFWQFTQYLFLRQWKKLKAYAGEKGIFIFGDMPLYLAYDSVEVWKYGNKLFRMDEERVPEVVAGCPPDAFSEDGQLWGNPTYDWEKMKEDDYAWWKERIAYAFRFFDIVRIDHFRGFDRYYAIPYGEETARVGEWVDGPKAALFASFHRRRIVAEDLGIIDEGVVSMMKEVGYPGMRVLSFAFDGNKDNPHKPSNYEKNVVAYSGTHDNMPFVGLLEDFSKEEREVFLRDFKAECRKASIRGNYATDEGICKTVVRLLFLSRANLAIVPYFDLMALGKEGRINHPSTVSSANWTYRFGKEDFSPSMIARIRRLVLQAGR